jgi:hypothetical protein
MRYKKTILLFFAAISFGAIEANEGNSTRSPLEKHSDFSATTKERDTLFLCPSRNYIAYTIKESWESGLYDEPNQNRPIVVLLSEDDYNRIVIPRIKE